MISLELRGNKGQLFPVRCRLSAAASAGILEIQTEKILVPESDGLNLLFHISIVHWSAGSQQYLP